MQHSVPNAPPAPSIDDWLKTYYFTRAIVSILWIGAAVTVGKAQPAAAALLVLYPAWDAVANYIDARKVGGLRANPSQALNFAVSTLTGLAVIAALTTHAFPVLAVFGAWAILSGGLQLVTGVRRWKAGAQWAMVLSGAQSILAGAFFFKMVAAAPGPAVVAIAPYAGFGAFYFLISAIWLTVKASRRRSRRVVA